jgi:hypothetical protein
MGFRPRVPQVSIIRRALKLSQEQFATTFDIPIGTIRDWQQGGYEPDAAARAYLRVIAREPDTVRRALAARTKPMGAVSKNADGLANECPGLVDRGQSTMRSGAPVRKPKTANGGRGEMWSGID